MECLLQLPRDSFSLFSASVHSRAGAMPALSISDPGGLGRLDKRMNAGNGVAG